MTEEVKDASAVEEKPDDTPQYTEVEQAAIASGWVPKDQWKGAEDDWTPAKAFLKFGEKEAEAKRLKAEASQKEKVIKAMKAFYLNTKEDVKKELVETIKRQKRDALKQEDYVKVAELDLQMEELSDNLDRKTKKHDEDMQKIEVADNTPPQEFFDWNAKNTWYQIGSSDPMVREADTLAIAYAQMNPGAAYTDVLKHVEDRIKRLYPEKFRNQERDKPAAINEPGEASGEPKGRKTVRLTEAEKQAAEMFGMTPEEYAKQLKEWDTKKGVA